MAPMMERTTVATGATGTPRAETPSRLTTTLYDLITALQDVVGANNDALVVASVVHLLRSGRLTWEGKTKRVCARGGVRMGMPCSMAHYALPQREASP